MFPKKNEIWIDKRNPSVEIKITSVSSHVINGKTGQGFTKSFSCAPGTFITFYRKK